MAHHLLPVIDRGWLDRVVNCFLIRKPEEVLASYVRTRDDPTLADLGLAQQAEIFERVVDRSGQVPPILDARDVLEHPRRMLTLLCAAVGVPFSETMLSWPAGPRATDGVWSRHWYASVERSTGFAAYRPPREPLVDRLRPLAAACQPYYRNLYDRRIVP